MRSTETSSDLRFRGELSPSQVFNPECRLRALNIEHGDLDAAIVALLSDSMFDELQITRLKKRKLQIRDEIAAILCALPPSQEQKAQTS
jgi:hypothetical protein